MLEVIGVQAYLIGGFSALFCLCERCRYFGVPARPDDLWIRYSNSGESVHRLRVLAWFHVGNAGDGSFEVIKFSFLFSFVAISLYEIVCATFGFLLVAAPLLTIKRKANDHTLFWSISVLLIWLTATTVVIWLAISLR